MTNPYLELTGEFNQGRLRALVSSGQADEERLARYQTAAHDWSDVWPEVARQIADLPLHEAYRIVTSCAEGVLPRVVTGGDEE